MQKAKPPVTSYRQQHNASSVAAANHFLCDPQIIESTVRQEHSRPKALDLLRNVDPISTSTVSYRHRPPKIENGSARVGRQPSAFDRSASAAVKPHNGDVDNDDTKRSTGEPRSKRLATPRLHGPQTRGYFVDSLYVAGGRAQRAVRSAQRSDVASSAYAPAVSY
jgi:hypothetical protein